MYVADQLFATLDPTTRRVELPSGRTILLSDTVGFIQKLPVTLVAAFRATLEEVVEADLLLHVVDASHPRAWDHADVVEDTLAELEASRIPKVLVLNKIDRGDAVQDLDFSELGYRQVIRTSATAGTGLDELLAAIEQVLIESLIPISLLIPYSQGDILAAIYETGVVADEVHTEQGVEISARVPARLVNSLSQFRRARSAPD